MDVLYIPQLDDGDGSGESATAGRYRILKRVPEDGAVALTDRAITRIELSTAEPVRLVVPPEVKGAARDFFVRLVVSADKVPEITFAAPTGETISLEEADEEVLKCELGVNTFAFTETDSGIFLVNRKRVYLTVQVDFDPCGGELDALKASFRLGEEYASLPKPVRSGYSFLGWFTEADGGVEVADQDRCKTGVTKLYAHWEVYVDPFVDAICSAKNLTFFTDEDAPWFVEDGGGIEPGAARSCPIGDNGRTTLRTTVQGRGTLSFRWRVSSEDNYDWLHLIVDGNEVTKISGWYEWDVFTLPIKGSGSHAVEWRYDKDGSCESYDDCGWVDDIVWTPEA